MFRPLTRAQVSFELGTEIGGEGKNSQTYKAHDPQLGADIVVKKIKKTNIQDHSAFFDESRCLYASSHPNVVQVHYACEDDEHIFLAMPYYKNGSVRSLMANQFLTVREIIRFGCQMLSGLHNVHSKGLVHFDIKSDNILLSDRGEALISDFGLAKPLSNGVATPAGVYEPNIPPEALKSTGFDARYDIFQAGLTLYSMCVGLTAYKAQFLAYFASGQFDADKYTSDIAAGRYPDRTAFPPHIPARLRKIIKRCLEVEPDARYQTALDCMNDLAQVNGNELDWRYSESDGERIWQKVVGGATYVFTVYSDLTSKLTKASPGGAPRNQSAGTIVGVKPKDISRVLGTY